MKEQNQNIEDKKKPEVIDLREVYMKLWGRKKLFIWTWIITAIIASAIILPVPRTYITDLSLAPEMGGNLTGGGLASFASSFGINMSNMETNDAFYPELYPDVISTNAFIVSLFDVRIKTIDGEIDTDYYTYLKDYQQETPYLIPFKWLKKQFTSVFVPKPDRPIQSEDGKINPVMLSVEDNNLVETIRTLIVCSVDKKTNVITISVEDQDPMVCTIIADSVRVRLQNFIIDYRTNKSRIDMEHYKQLKDSAYIEYQIAMDKYAQYSDSHQNSILQLYLSHRDELENSMQTKLQTYTAMNTQYEAAKAKVQERTPAFTILKEAAVPIKASKPKRVIFVVLMLFVATMCVSLYIFKKDILNQLTQLK